MISTGVGKLWKRPAKDCLAVLSSIPAESRQEVHALDLLKTALKHLHGLV